MKENSIDVLLIEDDPMVLEINRAFIEKVSGFKVTGMAANGAEGLKRSRNCSPVSSFLTSICRSRTAFIPSTRFENKNLR